MPRKFITIINYRFSTFFYQGRQKLGLKPGEEKAQVKEETGEKVSFILCFN